MGYATESLETYLADAASNKPAPGGGSVSALVGALASAMSEMAANFTTGKRRFRDVEDHVRACLERLEESRAELLTLVDADVSAYTGVGRAYALPKETAAQKAARNAAIQEALVAAMDVPLRIVRACRVVAETAAELVAIANPNLLTDVGVSAILAAAACDAARLNVEVNLKYIKAEDTVASVRPEVDEAVAAAVGKRQVVAAAVGRYLAE